MGCNDHSGTYHHKTQTHVKVQRTFALAPVFLICNATILHADGLLVNYFQVNILLILNLKQYSQCSLRTKREATGPLVLMLLLAIKLVFLGA